MRHILYKTTCLPTGEFYFGIHSSTEEDSWYVGSGKLVKQRIKQFGKNSLVREIINEFSSREEAELAETCIIQQHWKLPGSLNIRTSSKGWFKDRPQEERLEIGRKISKGMKESSKVKLSAQKRKGKSVTVTWTPESKKKSADTKRNAARERWRNALAQVDWESIDVTKFGWVGKVANQSGLKPQKIHKIIQDLCPDIYSQCFKRTKGE